MTDTLFEKTYKELSLKRDVDRLKMLDNLDKTILASAKKRIQQNDRTVMQEIVVPKWINWDLLRSWAGADSGKSPNCAICDGQFEKGVSYKNRFVCETCFTGLRNLS